MVEPSSRGSSFQKTDTVPAIVPVPAVNAAIFNREGKILVTRRSPKIRESGKWCLPGGHVELGELWISAMRREVEEEVGIKVTGEKLCGIYSDPKLTVTTEKVSEGYHAHFIVALFIVTDYEGEINPNDEVDLWGWFEKYNLPDPMVKSHPIRVQDAFEFNGEVYVR